MADILLKELSNTDIDWLIATGRQQQLPADTVLLQARQKPETIYLLLNGALTLGIPLQDGDVDAQEFVQLSRGEIIGETLLLNLPPSATTVKAIQDSIVLSIPQPQLEEKLQQDLGFSTHFYRSIALILSARLRQMFTMPSQLQAVSNQAVKEALLIFGELRDGDVDWLMMAGHLEKLAPGQLLVQVGRPLDALYIILDGLLSTGVCEGEVNPLTLCFECAYETASSQKIIDYLSRGEMSGTIDFLEFSPAVVTVRAVQESLVLSIPRSQLSMKLQQDMGFASRFYRVLATQLAETWQKAIGLLGCPQQMYHPQKEMDKNMEYDDELDLEALGLVSQGAARFSWMLKQLGVV
ncbi:MAG: cyclic nucleotide-binding domain-containing protein [Leptolyngbyaceae cyanobacterium SM1_3_5]|nr:cyclic nucleotide-binding domain-containing protein [Leptolyngbyaceae cyanobacterium SM1_3_5]